MTVADEEAADDVPPLRPASHWGAPKWDMTRDSAHQESLSSHNTSSHHPSSHPGDGGAADNTKSTPSHHPSSHHDDGGADTNAKREPVSLAVAADVAQAQIPEGASQEHARGDAVAKKLGSILGHRVPTLQPEPELVGSAVASVARAADGLKPEVNRSAVDSVARTAHDIEDGSGQSAFKRFLHAIDNYLHPPSKLIDAPQHHMQGHMFTSGHEGSFGPSNHAWNCVPHCPQQGGWDTSQTPAESLRSKHHHRLRASSFSTSIKSFASKHSTAQTKNPEHKPKPKPFFHLLRSQPAEKKSVPRFRGPLLYNCSDPTEHEAIVTTAVHVSNLYHMGHDVAGLEYHQLGPHVDVSVVRDEGETETSEMGNGEGEIATPEVEDEGLKKPDALDVAKSGFDHRARHALRSLGFVFRMDTCQSCDKKTASVDEDKCFQNRGDSYRCEDCVTRLYHEPSNTAIISDNRRTFIADGKMYDAIADLCQAAAQEIMAETCNLTWITICDGKGGGRHAEYQGLYPPTKPRSTSIEDWPRDEQGKIVIKEPIRALVGRQREGMDSKQPHDTFLVVTGKGKVRAGVFSRHHLMTTGLDPSTCLPLLCEAQDRGMNCVVIDPNARTDKHGMDTFELSIRCLFEQESNHEGDEESESDTTSNNDDCDVRAIIPADVDGSIYVLAHSAAGGQLVRYLLDQQELLSRIHCIAFTDSTHSIQWLKNHPQVASLIQSPKALYVRSANPMRDDDWENVAAGDECPKDRFWSHRFGEVRTVWAGTTEHSLSNWTAHKPIWEHFDKIREETAGAEEANGGANRKSSGGIQRAIGTDPVTL